MRATCFGVVLVGLLAGVPLAAQEVERPVYGPSFILFRFASESALAMYAGYRAGPLLVVAGMLQNPRSSYREIMGGVGRDLRITPATSATVAPAIAWSNTGWYAQLYVLPVTTLAGAELSATLQFSEPLGDDGTRAIYVSPAHILRPLSTQLAIGGAYYGSIENGGAAAHAAGPAVQLRIPGGAVTLELIAGLAHARNEVRAAIRSSF